ncbi:predicted protein [Chaetomium globosum CBS 148.51]|uniref:Uncharacterized protein n=1 Tax=Chaetomium globosum (strain ATCC 6205 / CBS 148.51 / DSM 1962 / NBRC 6347 / NRRL 1970) TaxID=306901 RepID=Q2GZ64_CHAGB|nr:uncharacterized protein CHGG_05182 [Chaetomium globosum CBS 148.51]EAQ88563.1 predicted protein [Chaetomium globosum CBS 148.51]
MKVTRAMESILQKEDMNCEEENDNEEIPRNHKNRTIQVAAVDEASEETRGLEQAMDHKLNNKLDIINAEVLIEFRKLKDYMAEEVAKITAQLTQELPQAREELTQAHQTAARRHDESSRNHIRNEEEVKKIKDIVEAKKTPGARVLRDQLYPVKVDNVNRTVVIDHEGKILPGAAEALGEENDVQIAKLT